MSDVPRCSHEPAVNTCPDCFDAITHQLVKAQQQISTLQEERETYRLYGVRADELHKQLQQRITALEATLASNARTLVMISRIRDELCAELEIFNKDEINGWREAYEKWVIERQQLRDRAEQAEVRIKELEKLLGDLHTYTDGVEARLAWLEEGRFLLDEKVNGSVRARPFELNYRAWLAKEPK